MRWKLKPKLPPSFPEYGQQRLRCQFLWSPLQIDGETRWMENASIVEQYQKRAYRTLGDYPTDGWVPIRWAN
jgi:hypothetical protein